MLTFETAESEHARRLGRAGFAASYTMPLFSNGAFLGFVFFNSRQADVFTETALAQLDIFGHLVCLVVLQELASIRTLSAALESARHIVHARDSETGSHLDRMSRYVRIIARGLADSHGLDDEAIERLQAYAPLHDIGKIGIPDAVLFTPDHLTGHERRVIEQHPLIAVRILEKMSAKPCSGTERNDKKIQSVVIREHGGNHHCVYAENSDAVKIPEMKCHAGNDPTGENRRTLDQRENSINIGHTAAYQDYDGIPACIFLVCQQGYKDSKSEIEADMLNIHCISVCTTVSNRYWY